ncbi:hypothetical protein BKP57_14865 [Virgibacillus sp. 6R]|nr:hypothetical protein BKP57_14865 [Virgibacillus sp. 6R]
MLAYIKFQEKVALSKPADKEQFDETIPLLFKLQVDEMPIIETLLKTKLLPFLLEYQVTHQKEKTVWLSFLINIYASCALHLQYIFTLITVIKGQYQNVFRSYSVNKIVFSR